MFLQRLLKPGPARTVGGTLYAASVAQARMPALYAVLGAPDTPNGLPAASTISPTRTAVEAPISAAGKSLAAT